MTRALRVELAKKYLIRNLRADTNQLGPIGLENDAVALRSPPCFLAIDTSH